MTTWLGKKSQIITENCTKTVVLKDIAKSLDMMGISVSTSTIQHCLNSNALYMNYKEITSYPQDGCVPRNKEAKSRGRRLDGRDLGT